MNSKTDAPIIGAETPTTDAATRDWPDPRTREPIYTGTIRTGDFARGAETQPEEADERALDGGSFASGIEEMPEANAAARRHPGTFADTTEPTEELIEERR